MHVAQASCRSLMMHSPRLDRSTFLSSGLRPRAWGDGHRERPRIATSIASMILDDVNGVEILLACCSRIARPAHRKGPRAG
eukprot:COSAG03_NODE_314_length_9077_cov_2.266095_1_plen_80_part_10